MRCSLLLAVACLLLAGPLFAAAKPNVLIIVADDLGYNDVGFQGSKEIPTPHLDKLAARSVRCTNGYVSHSFCSPTRAGMLTGRYQHRFGHENNPAWLPDSTVAGLPLSETTFPTLMKQAGYTTGAVGKWHLGAHPQFHPNKRGFDEYFGALGGGHVYFPRGKGGPEYQAPLNRNGQDEPHTKYITDHFGEEAAAFVGRHAGKDKPWLLYLAFNAPHTPLEAPQAWLDKLAHIQNQNRRLYAAMICAMDAAIGGVLSKLDQTQQRENTLIYFISDNGGPNLTPRNLGNFTDNSPLRAAKGALHEGGIRVPFLVSWPARLKPGTYDQPVIALDFLPTSLAAAGAADLTPKNLDGVNLLPFLLGENQGAPHDILFWRTQGPAGNHAARRGHLKFVQLSGGTPELYDLATDIGETTNLAAQKPEVVQQFTAAIGDWEKGTIPPLFESPRTGKPVGKKQKAK